MEMFGYYLRLAVRACARDPGVMALVVWVIGLGVGVCIMTLTIYHAMAADPIWWKSDRLYAVTLDSWAVDRPENADLPALPPPTLTWNDATALFRSDIPVRKVLTYPVTAVVMNDRTGRPLKITSRITTVDFFAAFDVPFQYGSAWTAPADEGPEPVIVLSHGLNERLFGGANSVGRTLRWNQRTLRIVGVLKSWMPEPRFFDVADGGFSEPEAAYVPWGWGRVLKMRSSNNERCWKAESNDTFEQLTGSECVWIQMWVEIDSATARDHMQNFLDAYWARQRKQGRFERPRNNRLSDVSTWLSERQVVRDDNRLLAGLAFVFLGVCLLNTAGVLLAKFLSGAPSAGLRRALGASRAQIFAQHLVLAAVLALAGSVLGLLLSELLLSGVRLLYSADLSSSPAGFQALARFNAMSWAWGVGLTFVSMAVAGLYPAWRIARAAPLHYLKR